MSAGDPRGAEIAARALDRSDADPGEVRAATPRRAAAAAAMATGIRGGG